MMKCVGRRCLLLYFSFWFVVLYGLYHVWRDRPLVNSHREWLYDRGESSEKTCLPAITSDTPAPTRPFPPKRDLTEEELATYRRDGTVMLRDVLSEEWLVALRKLVMQVSANPNTWDIWSSRLKHNYYGAQAATFLAQTSRCGREIARFAPITSLAAQLLGSSTLRVAEPTQALINYNWETKRRGVLATKRSRQGALEDDTWIHAHM